MSPKKTARSTANKAKTSQKSLDQAAWLTAALPFVAETGWTDALFSKAAASLDCDSALAVTIFPRGIKDLVAVFHETHNKAMLARIEAYRPFQTMKVRQKVAFAVRARLESLTPHKAAVHELIAWSLRPLNAPYALKLGWDLCDKIWWAAGDTATDYNHYTKRLLLAQVYQRTLMFWLKDQSVGASDSWIYLDARIAEVLEIGKKIGQAKDVVNIAKNFLKSHAA